MRSREISVSIIIQNLAQLKALFEKQWESIVGNCDEFLYLGGNEQADKAVEKGRKALREHREEKRLERREKKVEDAVRRYEQSVGEAANNTVRETRRTVRAKDRTIRTAQQTEHTVKQTEMSGSRAVWPQVLSVYAVKTTTDPDNAQEVATMDDQKKQLLTDIFWEMNDISYRTETTTETQIIETDDGRGNILEEEVEVTHTTLFIVVSHKDADIMASQYNFNNDQNDQLEELLSADSSMWMAVLYGIYGSDDMIVQVALTQIGNIGGEPYWSWYGFGSRVEWCACFVSWCADQCGYIENSVIPKYAGCVNGVNWFRDRGQWADNSIEPTPGMIIFFDWDSPNGSSGPQDGLSDHTGIVEKVENGYVYTVEGNSGDSCRENRYPVGYYEILGYGIPAY